LAAAAKVMSYEDMLKLFDDITKQTEQAFNIAVNEPKLTSRDELLRSNSAPLLPISPKTSANVNGKSDNMRKHMTNAYTELLDQWPTAVYIGEDVRHGG
jgi:hypothetical protein